MNQPDPFSLNNDARSASSSEPSPVEPGFARDGPPTPKPNDATTSAHASESPHLRTVEHGPTVSSEDRGTPSRKGDTAAAIGEEKPASDTKPHTLLDKVNNVAGEGLTNTVKAAAHRFHLESVQASGVTKLLHPTTARMRVRINESKRPVDDDDSDRNQRLDEMAVLWRARDQRKGRGSIAVPLLLSQSQLQGPRTPGRGKQLFSNILRMFKIFPYWDMAFWSGWAYSIGSALFVIDGAFAWGPLVVPGGEFEGEAEYGVPLCFFFGALFYQLGAVVAYLEAVNAGSFHGSAMRRLLEGHEKEDKEMLDDKLHDFVHHMLPHRRGKVADEEKAGASEPAVAAAAAPRRGGVDLGEAEEKEGTSSEYMRWRWYPTWHALKNHHAYEIGYLACAIQLFGVTLYGITSIVILPGILDSLNAWQTNAAYWIPQMVAAACFLTASIMFTFETQDKWWKPEPAVLGWWISVWSTVGSVGFELCAAFGPASADKTWCAYQSSLSSLWGSGAYLIGSLLQWYEAVNKHPVQELLSEPGEMKTWQVHSI
ncbi:hypothetical protein LTR53_011376 [Teratosphaeriaceae sp. CCFEE 6253]|nr:hypothetical protein LTR53_011376 [Teratosphaeriaceae sp. CCFEE 6253]